MFHIHAGAVINKPIEEVFAFVADNENDPQWCVPVIETTRIVGDAPGANTRYSFTSDGGLLKLRGEFEITEFLPPSRIAWRGYSPFAHYEGYYALEEGEGGTRITTDIDFNNKILYRLLEGAMQKNFAKGYDEQFRQLKRLLEEGSL